MFEFLILTVYHVCITVHMLYRFVGWLQSETEKWGWRRPDCSEHRTQELREREGHISAGCSKCWGSSEDVM